MTPQMIHTYDSDSGFDYSHISFKICDAVATDPQVSVVLLVLGNPEIAPYILSAQLTSRKRMPVKLEVIDIHFSDGSLLV